MEDAIFYGRYSTDHQTEKSIDDQVALGHRYARQHGYRILRVFSDAAVSGASLNRPGFKDMMNFLSRRPVKAVIVESFDRLSRTVADLTTLADDLEFRGIKLVSVSEGEANSILIVVKGLVAQSERTGTAAKVRRGQIGNIHEGSQQVVRRTAIDRFMVRPANRRSYPKRQRSSSAFVVSS